MDDTTHSENGAPARNSVWSAFADQQESSDLVGLRVLVIDDEDAILELFALMITALGGVAVRASTADEAKRRLAADEGFDVVVTDLVMPGTTGRSFLDWLAVEHGRLPVVAMSGIPEQNDRAAERPNVRTVLDKPFTPGELLAAIRLAATPLAPA